MLIGSTGTSLLTLSTINELPFNSVPDVSMNLTLSPGCKCSPNGKLPPLVDISFGTAVTFIFVFACESVALSVITFNAVLVPKRADSKKNVLSVLLSLIVNSVPAEPPKLFTLNTTLSPSLYSCP